MELPFENLTLMGWVLLVAFFIAGILFMCKAVWGVTTLRDDASQHSRVKYSLAVGLWSLPATISLLIAVGVLIGMPTESLQCWSLALPLMLIVSPFIFLGMFGIGYVQSARSIKWYRFLDSVIKKTRK